MVKSMIDLDKHRSALSEFWQADPFPHAQIDNFWSEDFCAELLTQIPTPESDLWNGYYHNAIEYKKTLNIWDKFDTVIYQAFTELCSRRFTDYLSSELGIPGLEPDYGLHGGGLHYYPPGGKLNPHIDYSHHPKLGNRRKVNILIYLNQDWQTDHGGQLGMWAKSQAESYQRPDKLIDPVYNSCVIFENSTHSYHGLASESTQGRYSMALYYLIADDSEQKNTKANFLPTSDQKDDVHIHDLINLRKTQRINTREK